MKICYVWDTGLYLPGYKCKHGFFTCGIPREPAEATVETLRTVFAECDTHNSVTGLGRSGGSQGLGTGEQ